MTRFNPYALGALTYQIALAIGEVREGRTTTAGGNTVTVKDSNRTEVDNFWNGGTLWITTDTLTNIAGNFAPISDYAQSGGIFTLDIALDDETQGMEGYAVAGCSVLESRYM